MFGDGSIQQVKDREGRPIPNRWRVVVSLGTQNGARKRVSRTVRGSKADAKLVRDQLISDNKQGIDVVAADKMTLAELIDEWLVIAAKNLKGDRFKIIKRRLDTVSEVAGTWKIKQIDAKAVCRMMDALVEKKTEDGKSFKSTTQNIYFYEIKRVFRYAVDCRYLHRNPMDMVKAPRKGEVHRKTLTKEGAQSLVEALKADIELAYGKGDVSRISKLLIILVALATGMRVGEMFGLFWESVDFENSTIDVVQAQAKDGQIKEPKTPASYRKISVDEATMAELARWKAFQDAYLDVIGIEHGPDSRVFIRDTGQPIRHENMRCFWETWKKHNPGFDDFVLHELRHSHISLLLSENNVPLKSVQSRVGHKKAQTTLDVYAKPLKSDDGIAPLVIGNLLYNVGPKASSEQTS